MLNENDLLVQMKAGSENAFTLLYTKYSEPMYINFLKMVKDEQIAEELVQDIFSRIWQKRETIQIGQSFSAYLYRSGQNMVYDFYRKLQRDKLLYDRFKIIATQNYTHIEEALHFKESEALLQKALNTLSPRQLEVYQLCKLEGRSYKEAAILLNISPHTVKEYLAKANQSIRSYLSGNMDVMLAMMLHLVYRLPDTGIPFLSVY